MKRKGAVESHAGKHSMQHTRRAMRLMSLLIVCVLALVLFSPAALAAVDSGAEQEEIGYGVSSFVGFGSQSGTSFTAGQTGATSMTAQLKKLWTNRSEKLDVSTWGYAAGPGWCNFDDVYFGTLFENPQLFYVDCYYSYTYRLSDNRLMSITPRYLVSKSKLPAYQKKYEQSVANALQYVNDSMTDLEKVIALHDYLALYSKYDNRFYTGGMPQVSYSSYGVLTLGLGVCQSYSLALIDLLAREGIDSCFVKSVSMNHGWVMVEVDGKWYHVDTTWDDPLNVMDYVTHDYLLCSGKAISNKDHYDFFWYTNDPAATDTRYDNAWWQELNWPMYYVNGRWVYTDGWNVYANNTKGTNPTLLICNDNENNDMRFARFKNKLVYSNGRNIYYCSATGQNSKLYWTLDRYKGYENAEIIEMRIIPYGIKWYLQVVVATENAEIPLTKRLA